MALKVFPGYSVLIQKDIEILFITRGTPRERGDWCERLAAERVTEAAERGDFLSVGQDEARQVRSLCRNCTAPWVDSAASV